MNNIKYSFKCCTYARIHTLQEALNSFLQLENANDSEFVIVNDYPLQTLIFEHPKVRIINLKKTFDILGDKENFAIENCQGNIIITADDDDIFLPNHLNNIRKYWKENTNILHWNGVFYNFPNITSLAFLGNSGMVYSRKAWEKIGKSPIMNAGGDTVLKDRIHELGIENVVIAHPPDEEISWFYRWMLPQMNGNASIFHQSGIGADIEGQPNIIQRHSEYIEEQRKLGRIPTGIIYLQPQWHQNYSELLKTYNEKNKFNPPK